MYSCFDLDRLKVAPIGKVSNENIRPPGNKKVFGWNLSPHVVTISNIIQKTEIPTIWIYPGTMMHSKAYGTIDVLVLFLRTKIKFLFEIYFLLFFLISYFYSIII